MAKISVIIPVYNSANYLKDCLDSLVNQKFKDIEIIIVNDGSTDNSCDIINKYMKKHKNIYLYTITNHGQSYARNYGISKASGEYISFVDSDDYVSLDLYSELSKKNSKDEYDIILFGYHVVDMNKNILFDKKYNFSNNLNVTDIEYLMVDPCPCNKLYKKSFLDKVNFKFPEGIIYEDYCYIPTLVKYNPVISYIDKCLYYYVYSATSTMRNDVYKEKYENLFKATDILYNSFRDEDKYKDEIEYMIYYHFLYEGSLNFYKFNKYEHIDKIASFMKDKYPNWLKNKYVREKCKKERMIAYLFYKRQYSLIKFIQKIKGGFR